MNNKFKQLYYSDDGYWRGKSAINKLAKKTNSTKDDAGKWLLTQPLYQIYLPAPKYIPRPNSSMPLYATPNDIHQTDILYQWFPNFSRLVPPWLPGGFLVPPPLSPHTSHTYSFFYIWYASN